MIFRFLIFILTGKFLDRFFFFAPDVIFDAFDAGAFRAVRAAEKVFFRFDSVTDDAAAAIGANRRELVNRAFETIENVRVSRRDNFEGQVIIISANLALCHLFCLLTVN